MSTYLETCDNAALDLLIERLEAAGSLTDDQRRMLVDAKRIMADRSGSKVAPHFDIPRALDFLTRVAKERRLCSYKHLAEACTNDPSAKWASQRHWVNGPNGLMQSIIRHCAARGIPQLGALVVRQDEVAAGPEAVPDRDGEAEYGFKRGLGAEGLLKQSDSTDAFVLESREKCFEWARTV